MWAHLLHVVKPKFTARFILLRLIIRHDGGTQEQCIEQKLGIQTTQSDLMKMWHYRRLKYFSGCSRNDNEHQHTQTHAFLSAILHLSKRLPSSDSNSKNHSESNQLGICCFIFFCCFGFPILSITNTKFYISAPSDYWRSSRFLLCSLAARRAAGLVFCVWARCTFDMCVLWSMKNDVIRWNLFMLKWATESVNVNLSNARSIMEPMFGPKECH